MLGKILFRRFFLLLLDGVAFVLRLASFSEGDMFFAGLISFWVKGSFIF